MAEICDGYLSSVRHFASSHFADGSLFNVSFLICCLDNTREYFIKL